MQTYIEAVNKVIAKVESHLDRLSDSSSDTAQDKLDALEGFMNTLQEAIDNLEAEWPQAQ
jgi:transcription elongation GreA/GreB family factor